MKRKYKKMVKNFVLGTVEIGSGVCVSLACACALGTVIPVHPVKAVNIANTIGGGIIGAYAGDKAGKYIRKEIAEPLFDIPELIKISNEELAEE